MDISAWWVLGAFLLGGYAGALLVALIAMAAGDGGHSANDVDGPGHLSTGGAGPA